MRRVVISAGEPGAQGRVWRDVYAEVEIRQTYTRTQNHCTIRLFNLSPGSIAWLEMCTRRMVHVEAGEEITGLIFSGEITDVAVAQSMPNTVTTIEAQEALAPIRDATFAKSYPAFTSRTQVISDIAKTMGVAVGYVTPTLAHLRYPSSVAWCHRASDALDDILAPDFVWSVQADRLYILGKDEKAPGRVLAVTPRSGLIGSPAREQGGVTLDMLFRPIRPGQSIYVDSAWITGDFRVVEVTHRIATYGDPWITRLTCR